jgi:hypothetical protein
LALSEARVIAVLTGERHEHDLALTCERRQPLDAVAPPVEPAEQTNHNDLGVDCDAVDP